MKKSIKFNLLLLIIVVLGLLGCAGEAVETESNQTAESTDGNSDVYTAKFSHNVGTETALHKAIEFFKEEVEQNSEGQINIDIYPDLQLGSMQEQAEQVQFGGIDMTVQGTSILSSFAEELELLDFPFLWPTEDKMWEILQGETGDKILSVLDNTGFKGLAHWAVGFKHFTHGKEPITNVDDLKGQKMRVMPSQLLIKQYEAWGANPTPIDFGELYNALQQGVVDGHDNNLEAIYLSNLHEVQDYLTLSQHNMLSYIFVVNEDWYNGLSDELQQVVTKAARDAGQFYFEIRIDEEKEILEELESLGVEITELSDEARMEFIERSEDVYDEFLKTDIQREIFEEIREKTGE